MHERFITSNQILIGSNNAETNISSAQLIIDQKGAGDSYIAFTAGAEEYLIGIDNSGSDTFVIKNGNSLSATTSFIMDSAGDIGLGGLPDNSAVLAIQSTTKGFLPPAMTSAQMQSVATPSAGLIVYNTVSGGLYVYTSAGAWHMIDTKIA